MKKLCCCGFALLAALLGQAGEITGLFWGANIGYISPSGQNTQPGMTNSLLSGWWYSANTGWIHLGDGSPVNGTSYGNTDANDFGVNVDESGNLRGLAYSGNIGWISFENTGDPKMDRSSGLLNGFAYSANAGWINLNPLLNPFRITGIARLGNGNATLNGVGLANAAAAVEASNDLVQWQPAGAINVSGAGVWQFIDETANTQSKRFYRLRP